MTMILMLSVILAGLLSLAIPSQMRALRGVPVTAGSGQTRQD